MSLEETFAKVAGRHASDEERQRLYRLRDALGLRDNDAFWSIVMALEHYDSFFRRYPAELAEYTERCIEDARAAFAAAAEREAAQVQRTLAEKVAETSVTIARRLAERPVGTRREINRVTMLRPWWWRSARCASTAGIQLAGPLRPFWATKHGDARSIANERRRRSWRHRPGGSCSRFAGRNVRSESLPGTAAEAVEHRDKTVG